MRITYFSDSPRLGGAERFLADIVAGAHAAGHEVTVLSPQRFLLDFVGDAVPEVRLVEAGRTNYKSARSIGGTITALAREAPGLRRALQRTDATLLHANNGGYPGSDLCRLAVLVARTAGIPLRLLTVNSAPLRRDASQPQLQAAIDWMLWHSVNGVHATTQFVETGLRAARGMPPNICTHIPYGVVAPTASPAVVADLRRRLALSPTRPLIGMVSATGDREKGHHVLAEAMALLDSDIRAVVVGPHPGASFVRHIAALGLTERVTLVGPVSSAEVGPYLCAMDLIVVPSTAYESLPLVVLEAMAACKPVFASRLSGIPEAVVDKETGRLFTPGAADELGMLLRNAVEAPDKVDRMGRAAHERWRQRFTPEAMISAMLALYSKLAAAST